MDKYTSNNYEDMDGIEEIRMRQFGNPLELYAETSSTSDYVEISDNVDGPCDESKNYVDVDFSKSTAVINKVDDIKSHQRKSSQTSAINCLTLLFAIVSNILLAILVVFAAMVYIRGSNSPKDAPGIEKYVPEIQDVLYENNLYEALSNISEDLREQINKTSYLLKSSMPSPLSCGQVLGRNKSSTSGYYEVKTTTGDLVKVYCDMNRICGGIAGGWMRVADLNPENCPDGLKTEFNGSRARACSAKSDEPGCAFVFYRAHNILYSRVCIKVRGYGVGTFDGLNNMRGSLRRSSSVLDNYLDGVSITANAFHIWSFVAGDCSCADKPQFITYDWSCDGTKCDAGNFCSFLWNSTACGETTPFLKALPVSISSDIIVRVCRDEPRNNEDVAITEMELYVQ